MIIEVTESDQLANLANVNVSRFDHDYSFWGGHHVNSEGMKHDSLRDILLSFAMPAPPMYLPTYLGRYPYNGRTDTLSYFRGLLPGKTDFGVFDRVRTLSANWHNAKELLAGDWHFVSSQTPHVPGENVVTHLNMKGRVRTNLPSDLVIISDGMIGPHLSDSISFVTTEDGIQYEPHGSSVQPPIVRTNISAQRANLIETFEGVTFQYPGIDFPSCQTIDLTYSNVVITLDGDRLVSATYHIFFYRHDTCFGDHWVRRHFDMEIYLTGAYVVPSMPFPDGVVSLQELGSFSYTLKCTQLSSEEWLEGTGWIPEQWAIDNGYSFPDTCEVVLPAVLTFESLQPVVAPNTGFSAMMHHGFQPGRPNSAKALRDFWNSVDMISTDLAPSVFLSTQDAIETHFPSLEGNYLEFLSELGSIRSLLRPDEGIVNFLRAASSKNITSNATALIDLLADQQLLYSFGIAPTVSDAKDIASNARRIRERYLHGNLFDKHIIHGKFTFSIPDGSVNGFNGLSLITRSKLVVDFGAQGILAALMPVKAAGLLPSLGNVWDLVQYSFVADWFFSIGDRLSALDTQSIILCMDSYYSVHSIKVLWDIPVDVLDQYAMSAETLDHPYFSYYCRSIMNRLPVLANSKFDFWRAHGPSSWRTGAAFAYKVFSK